MPIGQGHGFPEEVLYFGRDIVGAHLLRLARNLRVGRPMAEALEVLTG